MKYELSYRAIIPQKNTCHVCIKSWLILKFLLCILFFLNLTETMNEE